MVHDLGEANRDWAKLAPAPRVAPLWFRWRWLVVRPILVLVGSAVFGCGCLASMAFAVNTDPIGAWRLAMARREAPGDLKKAEDTGISGGEVPIFRLKYTFRLPNGTLMRGTSFLEASEPLKQEAVTVEYDPRDPRINRIRGTRTGFLPPFVYILWLVPPVGLAIIAGSIAYGLRQIRVLERGELARANITSCNVSVEFNCATGWINPRTDPPQATTAVKSELSFEEFHRLRELMGPGPRGYTSCTLEFQTPGGKIVQARRLVDFGGPLGQTPKRTVLYDPEHPRRALLCLEDLPAWVRVTPDGVWIATEDQKGVGRMGWLALCWFGGLPLGWIVGVIERAVHWH